MRLLVLRASLSISPGEPEVRGTDSWDCISELPGGDGDQSVSTVSVEGTWLPRQPLQTKAPPLTFQTLYHLQEFLYDLREPEGKTFPQIPAFLLNHVTLNFPLILLGEGRLGAKPN